MEAKKDEQYGNVYLGFAEYLDEPLDVDLDFPDGCDGKVGGKPVWLNYVELPYANQETSDLTCVQCKKPLSFLLQVCAPLDQYEHCFLRTLYVFCCKNGECHKDTFVGRFRVLRSQLSPKNDFYSEHDGNLMRNKNKTPATICDVCGQFASKHCGKCKQSHYCSREHQVEHWKAGHSKCCGNANASQKFLTDSVFEEMELVTEVEDYKEEEELTEDQLNKVTKELTEKYKEAVEAELDNEEMYTNKKKDKTFSAFQKRVKQYGDQVLRYYGVLANAPPPLWVSDEGQPKESDVPTCEGCGSKRVAEFQIMPQLLYKLKVEKENDFINTIDWGVLTVYTCPNSCESNKAYKEEFLWRQHHSAHNDVDEEEEEDDNEEEEEEEEEKSK